MEHEAVHGDQLEMASSGRSTTLEIEHYLRTGEYDPAFLAWPGDVLARCRVGGADLRHALILEVRRRERSTTLPQALAEGNLVAFTRNRIEPMVRGLFPRSEQAVVISMLERSVVLLTPASIEKVINQTVWLNTAWSLANLYLGSVGGELLSKHAPRIVGLSEETTCYVSAEYFRQTDRFSDFVVHEAAHVFHNCKRKTVGLPETRRREWLLPIDFRKRETFAYACEAYRRTIELAKSRADRLKLFEELAHNDPPADDLVNPTEYLTILREAISHRNGWKTILTRCTASP